MVRLIVFRQRARKDAGAVIRRNNRITHDCNVIALHREVRVQRRLLEVRRAHDLRAVTVQHCIQWFAVHQLLIREIISHANAAGQHRRRIRRRVIDHCHLRDAIAVFVPVFLLLRGNHEKFSVFVGAEVAHVLHIRLADAAVRQAKCVKVCHSALVVPCVHQHQHSIARCRHRVRKKGIAVIFLLLDEDFRVLHRCNIGVHGLAVFAADGEDAAGQVIDAVHLFAVSDEHGEAMRRVRQFRARESVLFQVFQPFLQVFQLRIASRSVHIRRNKRHFLLTGLPSVERIQARGVILHKNRRAVIQRKQPRRGKAFRAFLHRQRFIQHGFFFAQLLENRPILRRRAANQQACRQQHTRHFSELHAP